MGKFEKFSITIIFGAVMPVFLFLAGWWGSIGRVSENMISVAALAGLASGVMVDILFFRKWLRNVYDTDMKILMIIYLFYSICIFGFFMGVPVFNLLAGIVGGMFAGRKLYYDNASINKVKCNIKRLCSFTSAVMLAICLASAYFALKDPGDTARNLEGMFNIGKFSINTGIVVGIIVIGGFALIIFQYWLTKKAAMIVYNKGKS